jgi:LAS superfamily LD-carboxypeptidase LdcB
MLGSGVQGLSALAMRALPSITTTAEAAAAAQSEKSSTHVPELLRQFGNGQIPREALTLIGIGQHRLWGPAAESFMAMRADAAAAGVPISITDSYRSFAEQVDLAERKGLTKNGGLAATPGLSEHGWGLAIDADVDRAGFAWLTKNAGRYGWVMPMTREPWHWEFHGTA